MNKRRERKRLIKKIAIIILILVMIIIVLFFIEYYPKITFAKEPEKYFIEDECGLVVGNLIHQIKNEGECRIECRNECEVRDKKFYDSEFIARENACYLCNCYCK